MYWNEYLHQNTFHTCGGRRRSLPGEVGRENRCSPNTQPVRTRSASENIVSERRATLKLVLMLVDELEDEVPEPEDEPPKAPRACSISHIGCSVGAVGAESAGVVLRPLLDCWPSSNLNSGRSGPMMLPSTLPQFRNSIATIPQHVLHRRKRLIIEAY